VGVGGWRGCAAARTGAVSAPGSAPTAIPPRSAGEPVAGRKRSGPAIGGLGLAALGVLAFRIDAVALLASDGASVTFRNGYVTHPAYVRIDRNVPSEFGCGSDGCGMYVLGTGGIDAKTAIEVARGAKLEIHPVVRERVAEAAGRFGSLLATGQPVYGVTTEVAARSAVPIAPEDRPAYQLATLRSHACGLGPPLDRTAARAAWVAKLACLATGRPGASVGLLDSLKTALNAGLAPSIPSTGSLAASGDLIPSAHAALPLIGEGELLDGESS